MRIASVTDSAIIFDNGNSITYFHSPDCEEDSSSEIQMRGYSFLVTQSRTDTTQLRSTFFITMKLCCLATVK